MIDLTKSAMLVCLSLSSWSGRKHDHKLSESVAKSKNAERDRARVHKLLVSKEAIDPTQRIVNAWRNWHYDNTMPWIRGAHQLLPVMNFEQYSAESRDWKKKYDEAADKFVEVYPREIERAKKELGGMFNPFDYPSVNDMRRRFRVTIDILPVPTSGDFRVDVGQREVKRMQKLIERAVKARVNAAMDSIWRRLYDAIAHMQTKLKDPEAKFKNSLVDNIRELTNLLPRLNVTGDANLTKMIAEAKKNLCETNPEVLRDDDIERDKVAKKAATILKAMGGMFNADERTK